MAQHNITTLYIQDPNGGQPQMIKVLGAKPSLGSTNFVTLNSSSGSPSSSNTGQQQKTIYRTVTTTQAEQGGSVSGLTPGTIIHAGKLTNGQIVTLPRVAGTAGSIIRPVVVPASNLQQFKSSLGSPQQASLSRPVLIRTQTGNMVTTASTGQVTKLSNARPGVLHTSVQQIQQQRLKTQLQQQKQLLQQHEQHVQQSVQVESQRQQSSLQQQQQPKPQQIVIQKPQQFKLQQLSNPRQIVQLQQQQHTTQQQQQQLQNSPPKTLLTPILDHTAARKRHDFDFDYSIDNKRRKTEKGGKGLRHFSMKVCEKVKAKGRTSYNEVADELVAEFCDPTRCVAQGDANDDQKNIRRRVYDALNVLMAMDIISKEKKEIRWLGLPTNTAQECHKLLHERSRRQDRIRLKTQQLHDLILQHIAFKRLVERNRLRENERGGPPPPNTAIHLPFVVVATANSTTIDCSIANDKTEYLFNFDGSFEVHDDIEVLKRMGLALGLEKGECSKEDVTRAKEMLPKALESYVDDLSRGPPPPHILSRDELVQQLGGVSIAGGEFGAQAGGGGGLLVMETSDSIGGALGGVQLLSTEGGVLEGRVARSIVLDSPDYSAAGDDDIEDSDTELG